jgi:hypothetical protein
VRIHESSAGGGLQLGFSTDTGEPDINFNTKNGSDWTRAIQVGDLSMVTTLEFALDANQEGPVGTTDNLILLTDVQIYIGSEALGISFATPEDHVSGGYTGTPFDSSDNSLLQGVEENDGDHRQGNDALRRIVKLATAKAARASAAGNGLRGGLGVGGVLAGAT